MENKKRRSGIRIMIALIGLIKPLLHVMVLAIILGTAGYLCAISLTIMASRIILGAYTARAFIVLIIAAILRGVLHYAEQYCNHYIAFKILALIRHKVFAVLRKLCPAKLEGKEKGNLISIITSDIELLEVFYAHTVSPIAIAFFVSGIMTIFIGHYNVFAGLFALTAYCVVGILIPIFNGKNGAESGLAFRNKFGELNTYILDSLRGVDETIQYGQGENQKNVMNEKSLELGRYQKTLSKLESNTRSVTNLMILGFSLGMSGLAIMLQQSGSISFSDAVTVTVAMMGSFGPVVALSNLSNNLNQTLASGERVLSLLEEEPMVKEIKGAARDKQFTGVSAENVTFSYEEEVILKNYSIDIQPEKIIGIHGRSGSGKSTLLKLFMRFWDVNDGAIKVSNQDVRGIPTRELRNTESYVTQATQLFHDSIYQNIALAKENATLEEVKKAARKASIHDFIMSLPKQYETKVGELGDTLSGGERQRIGIARAFLHDAPLMLLDEPTSNLDSLNEGIILKSLKEESDGKTVVLISHRKSTMNVADKIYHMENGRIS